MSGVDTGCTLTMSYTMSAVRHGTVLFSTMMAPGLATKATDLVADSNMEMSVANPAPKPLDLVGVLTLKKTMSATAMCMLQSVEKNRFGCLARDVVPSASTLASVPSLAIRTMSLRPGSWIGRCFDCQRRVRSSFMSTTVTVISGLPYAMTAAVGPPCPPLVYYEIQSVQCAWLTDVTATDEAYSLQWKKSGWLGADVRSRAGIARKFRVGGETGGQRVLT